MSHSSSPGSRFVPPLWARWVLSLGVGVILLVALIVFVEHNDNNAEATQSPAAVARANREAEIVVAQDQAPHVVRVRAGIRPQRAMVRSVRADMAQLIARGTIEGTLQHVACRRAGGTAAAPAYSCTAVVADVNYPFLGVVDVPARRLTFCKRDEPPVPSMNIPVSPRCRS